MQLKNIVIVYALFHGIHLIIKDIGVIWRAIIIVELH